jgi:hypothetical protein
MWHHVIVTRSMSLVLPDILAKDFRGPKKQFKISPRYARLIQRFARRDSIVELLGSLDIGHGDYIDL